MRRFGLSKSFSGFALFLSKFYAIFFKVNTLLELETAHISLFQEFWKNDEIIEILIEFNAAWIRMFFCAPHHYLIYVICNSLSTRRSKFKCLSAVWLLNICILAHCSMSLSFVIVKWKPKINLLIFYTCKPNYQSLVCLYGNGIFCRCIIRLFVIFNIFSTWSSQVFYQEIWSLCIHFLLY